MINFCLFLEAGFSCGKEIDQAFYKACLYAGVNLTSSECVDASGKVIYI